jgi:hypothetical protein
MSLQRELDNRRRGFLTQCRWCRWGSVRDCDRALTYRYLTMDDRNRLLRLRAQVIHRRRMGLYALMVGVVVTLVFVGANTPEWAGLWSYVTKITLAL